MDGDGYHVADDGDNVDAVGAETCQGHPYPRIRRSYLLINNEVCLRKNWWAHSPVPQSHQNMTADSYLHRVDEFNFISQSQTVANYTFGLINRSQSRGSPISFIFMHRVTFRLSEFCKWCYTNRSISFESN